MSDKGVKIQIVSSSGLKSSESRSKDVKHIKIDNVKSLYEIYEFQEKIGHGTFGTVLAAIDKITNIHYAIKIINKSLPGQRSLQDIHREINILKAVDHPNIIVLFKIYESYKKFYMIFEKCDDNLFNVFKTNNPIPEKNVKKITLQLVGAVYYLHKNDIVHRDIKMENILLKGPINDPNDDFVIKLTDFGLSVIKTGAGIKSMLTERCGTVLYMAPEILLQHTYSELCDVWSIGVVLYALLLGRFPFFAPKQDELIKIILRTEPEINQSLIGQDAADLLYSILRKDPVNRLTTLEVLKHPWLMGRKKKHNKDETIVDFMKKWRSELILPGQESDWMLSYSEQSEYSIFPQSIKYLSERKSSTTISHTSSYRTGSSKTFQKKNDGAESANE